MILTAALHVVIPTQPPSQLQRSVNMMITYLNPLVVGTHRPPLRHS